MQRLVLLFCMPIECRTDKQLPAKLKVYFFAGFGHEKGFGIMVVLRVLQKTRAGGKHQSNSLHSNMIPYQLLSSRLSS